MNSEPCVAVATLGQPAAVVAQQGRGITPAVEKQQGLFALRQGPFHRVEQRGRVNRRVIQLRLQPWQRGSCIGQRDTQLLAAAHDGWQQASVVQGILAFQDRKNSSKPTTRGLKMSSSAMKRSIGSVPDAG